MLAMPLANGPSVYQAMSLISDPPLERILILDSTQSMQSIFIMGLIHLVWVSFTNALGLRDLDDLLTLTAISKLPCCHTYKECRMSKYRHREGVQLVGICQSNAFCLWLLYLPLILVLQRLGITVKWQYRSLPVKVEARDFEIRWGLHLDIETLELPHLVQDGTVSSLIAPPYFQLEYITSLIWWEFTWLIYQLLSMTAWSLAWGQSPGTWTKHTSSYTNFNCELYKE